MSLFSENFRKRIGRSSDVIEKSLMIDEHLNQHLQYLSQNVYEANVNDLFVCALEQLVKEQNVELYPSKSSDGYIKRSFRIPRSIDQKLKALKTKYRISYGKLVNIAIYQALKNEEIIS